MLGYNCFHVQTTITEREGCKIQLDAMREINMMTVLNLHTAWDKHPLQIGDPDKAEFKVLTKKHAPMNAFDTKYKPSFRICKWISDITFHAQDSAVKVRHVSVQHLKLLHPPEHALMHLPDITSLGQMTKYIYHPFLMPNLHIPMETQNK